MFAAREPGIDPAGPWTGRGVENRGFDMMCEGNLTRWLVYLAFLRAFKRIFQGFSRIVFRIFTRKLSENYPENRLKGPKTVPEAFPEYPEITNKPVSQIHNQNYPNIEK